MWQGKKWKKPSGAKQSKWQAREMGLCPGGTRELLKVSEQGRDPSAHSEALEEQGDDHGQG